MDDLVLTLLVLGLLISSLETFFTAFNTKGRRRGSTQRVEANPITRRVGLLPALLFTCFFFFLVALAADYTLTLNAQLYQAVIVVFIIMILFRGFFLVYNAVG